MPSRGYPSRSPEFAANARMCIRAYDELDLGFWGYETTQETPAFENHDAHDDAWMLSILQTMPFDNTLPMAIIHR
jgi:hypothetical protein